MQELDDIALWRQYLEHDSEEAFATLVVRHVDKVYSVAWRHVNDPHAAAEITQAVFIILARKARRLGLGVILSGWLYQTARLTAVTYVRSAIRRTHREQEAYMQSITNDNGSDGGPEVWTEIAPQLDAAMAGLKEADRHAVVLRYFDGKSLREVGTILGANEEAAKKRVNRALEKLRVYLAKHGVHSTTAIIAGTISANSVQAAPVAVAKAVTLGALAQTAAAGTPALVQGTLKLMAWTKLKVATLTCAGILLAGGTAFVAIETARASATHSVDPKIWDLYSQAFAQAANGKQATAAVVQVMTNHPPITLIRQSQPEQITEVDISRVRSHQGNVVGIGTIQGHVETMAPLVEVLRYAYNLDPDFPQNRILIPDGLAFNRYDFIDTMPHGGREILQRELKEQFGLVASLEIHSTLRLIVKNPAVGGLHPHRIGNATGFKSTNVTMAMIADGLSQSLGVTVTDQTGLTGGFDYSLDLPDSPTPDDIKKAILDQLGLGLIPAADNQGVEYLNCQEQGTIKN